jgi:hypothetical protein
VLIDGFSGVFEVNRGARPESMILRDPRGTRGGRILALTRRIVAFAEPLEWFDRAPTPVNFEDPFSGKNRTVWSPGSVLFGGRCC